MPQGEHLLEGGTDFSYNPNEFIYVAHIMFHFLLAGGGRGDKIYTFMS